MKKGTLVLVEDHEHMGPSDRAAIARDGNLWIVDDAVDTLGDNSKWDKLMWCRSLATGGTHPWYPHEVRQEP